MDQHKLRSLVFEKTGVKVDIDDPIFALVALNEAVLAESVERHIARIDAASQELAEQARAAGGLAPARAPASPAAPATAGYAPAPAAPVQAIATQSPLLTPRELRLLAAAAGISLLTALLVTGVQALFSKPAAAPQLTVQQAAALAQAEKLTRAIDKLDAKAREQIQAELQK
ncbi:hypothetical protein ASD15_01695 [Massilia sp. Root351]|jgi:hypothetical protein|uniref:hypothetical protein n=1 Tax=Massilia sp. Root351 TaxID=1736522 RepID=UPI00070A8DC8|nr:hypothetical protein [Massilia sp. Root351]KQV90811.1 hypothetical protein ASD15_01695 [Massilia sp. Root351]